MKGTPMKIRSTLFLALTGLLAVSTACKPEKPASTTVKNVPPATAAGTNADCSNLDPDVTRITQGWLGISSLHSGAEPGAGKLPQDLDRFLIALNQPEFYENLSPGGTYLAAQLANLYAWRSAVWRASPIFKRGEGKGIITSTTRNFILMLMQKLFAAQALYLPTDQWRLAFEYIAYPHDSLTNDNRWTKVSDFQSYLFSEKLPGVGKTPVELFQANLQRITGLENLAGTGGRSFLIDNNIFYGGASFQDGIKRCQSIGQGELLANLSTMEAGLHALYSFRAYDYDDLPNLMQTTATLMGINGLWQEGLGFPKRSSIAIVQEAGFSSSFNRTANAGEDLRTAWAHLQNSVSYAARSWEIVKARPKDETPFVLQNMAPWQRTNQAAMDNILRMVDLTPDGQKKSDAEAQPDPGWQAFTSAVTGEAVEVNLYALYHAPPASLRDLLPQAADNENFDVNQSVQVNIMKDDGSQDSVDVPNYNYGRVLKWPAELNNYIRLPSGNGDLADATRILAQTEGGWFVNNATALLIF